MLVFAVAHVRAAPVAQEPAPPNVPVQQSDQECRDCHDQRDLTAPLPNGETLYLTVDRAAYGISIHGRESVACTDCHTGITQFPHPPLGAQNPRQVAIQFSATCSACHEEQATGQHDSIHQAMLDQGNEDAAVCADCHNPHYTRPPNEPRSKIVTTCARCHSGIAQDYRQTVHGAALVDEENPDVPSCIDCHGVHNIPDPRTAQFLLNSPQLCASCHTDAEKMAPYGLNTNVVSTYVADFHGTTVTLFEQRSPDQLPNKPLCIDCHGIHNIKSVKDPESTVIKDNLLATCQKCHPSATANFSGAWLSHYTPSPERNALVYYVNLFYQILIPTLIGGMVVFVVTDAGKRVVRRVRGGRS
jgi:predicted CXXCH cytochrome family protein